MGVEETGVLFAKLKALAYLFESESPVAHGQAAPGHILNEKHVQCVGDESGADGEIDDAIVARGVATATEAHLTNGLLLELQLLQVHERFVAELLSLVKHTRLHGVHNCEQVDEDAQMVLVHPVEVLKWILRDVETLLAVVAVQPTRQGLYVVLKALESVADALHLTTLQEIGDL